MREMSPTPRRCPMSSVEPRKSLLLCYFSPLCRVSLEFNGRSTDWTEASGSIE